MLRKMMSYVLVMALLLTVGNFPILLPVEVAASPKAEAKVYDTATMEDDFTDDCVMVILNHTESLKFRSYAPSDFPEVSCKAIEDLSSASAAKVQAKLRGDEIATRDVGEAFMRRNVNVDTFRTILCLKLENPGKGNVLQAVRALEQREDVYYAGPDYRITRDASTSTTRGPVLPGYDYDNNWGADAIELSTAWQIETGSSTVKVGVIDSGIDASHPDLQGRVNTSLSRNFTSDSISPTTDPCGHGTHVAGIIGGIGNNTHEIRGVCQNVTLVSLRVFETLDFGALGSLPVSEGAHVLAAINYADDMNIPILNISLKVADGATPVITQSLNNYPGIAICSAGNDGLNTAYYPASAACDNVMSVGASTQANSRASFSNYGQQVVDLFAPGENIASCFPKSLCAASGCTYAGHIAHGYHYQSGTSMAAPYVAGVAALMLSLDSNMTSTAIKETILENVKAYAALEGICVSGGLLNAKNILSLHSMHSEYIYYTSYNANLHRRRCHKCSEVVLEPHAWDGMGGCMLCSYSN